MKKFLSAAVAATVLFSTAGAAMAQPYRGYDRGYSSSYRNDWRGNDWRRDYRYDRRYDRGYHRGHNNNAGAAIGIGLGILALGAIIASSQNSQRYDYRDGYYYGR